MTISVTRLAPCFAARIDGVDIGQPVAEPAWGEIRAAFDEHSVLVFRGQRLDDEAQIAFSRRFGALEVSRSMNPAAGTPFARQSNLDIKTGEVIPSEDRRQLLQAGPVALLAAVGAHHPARGRRHRVRQRA